MVLLYVRNMNQLMHCLFDNRFAHLCQLCLTLESNDWRIMHVCGVLSPILMPHLLTSRHTARSICVADPLQFLEKEEPASINHIISYPWGDPFSSLL